MNNKGDTLLVVVVFIILFNKLNKTCKNGNTFCCFKIIIFWCLSNDHPASKNSVLDCQFKLTNVDKRVKSNNSNLIR